MIEISTRLFCLLAIGLLVGLQLFAWYSGHNGTVFAFTSACIASMIGFVIGVKINFGKK